MIYKIQILSNIVTLTNLPTTSFAENKQVNGLGQLLGVGLVAY
jgi:hypothetical protein